MGCLLRTSPKNDATHGGRKRGDSGKSISWTIQNWVEYNWVTKVNGVAKWRDHIVSTQFGWFPRVSRKLYSKRLSFTNSIQQSSIVPLWRSHNLMTTDIMTILQECRWLTPQTEPLSTVQPITKYEQRKWWGSSDEVMKSYKNCIIGTSHMA